ncbi:MAG: hypothetical protein ABIL39_10745 [candidate division WOR-3 bacterium]
MDNTSAGQKDMVGESPEKRLIPYDETEFSNFISKFIGKKHYLANPEKGWDCVNFLLEVYGHYGCNLPQEIEGITKDNYDYLWRKKRKEAVEIMKKFLFSLGKPIDPNYAIMGDLIIFEGKEMVFGGIYNWGANVIVVFDKGVFNLPIRFLKDYIIGARRVIEWDFSQKR